MVLQWTSKALGDLARLYEFLAQVNQPAAARCAVPDEGTGYPLEHPAYW